MGGRGPGDGSPKYVVHANVAAPARIASINAAAAASGMAVVAGDFGDGPYVAVDLQHGQRVVAWPKFGTWAIGFEHVGDDRNVNLPLSVPAAEILVHIRKSSTKPIELDDALCGIAALQLAIPWLCEQIGIPMPHDPRAERP
jgi:hypothetical protein